MTTADSPPTPGRWTEPGPGCSKALPYPATQINGIRGTGSIHQRSSPNSSCKHKNDDIFLMTTKQLKLQECISSPFSGQYSQHVCAFNVPNTAAQNTLNTSHLTRWLLKVVEGKHTSLTCVVAQNQNTRTKTTEGLGFNCLVVCCYCFICNLKPTPLLQLLCSLQVPISTLHAPAPKVPQT